jgi:hypothetical protein
MCPRFVRVGQDHRKLYHKWKRKVFGTKEKSQSLFPIMD